MIYMFVTCLMSDRVSYLESGAGLEARDELSVQTGGVKGQRELFWDTLKLQLHLGANFLRTEQKPHVHVRLGT